MVKVISQEKLYNKNESIGIGFENLYIKDVRLNDANNTYIDKLFLKDLNYLVDNVMHSVTSIDDFENNKNNIYYKSDKFTPNIRVSLNFPVEIFYNENQKSDTVSFEIQDGKSGYINGSMLATGKETHNYAINDFSEKDNYLTLILEGDNNLVSYIKKSDILVSDPTNPAFGSISLEKFIEKNGIRNIQDKIQNLNLTVNGRKVESIDVSSEIEEKGITTKEYIDFATQQKVLRAEIDQTIDGKEFKRGENITAEDVNKRFVTLNYSQDRVEVQDERPFRAGKTRQAKFNTATAYQSNLNGEKLKVRTILAGGYEQVSFIDKNKVNIEGFDRLNEEEKRKALLNCVGKPIEIKEGEFTLKTLPLTFEEATTFYDVVERMIPLDNKTDKVMEDNSYLKLENGKYVSEKNVEPNCFNLAKDNDKADAYLICVDNKIQIVDLDFKKKYAFGENKIKFGGKVFECVPLVRVASSNCQIIQTKNETTKEMHDCKLLINSKFVNGVFGKDETLVDNFSEQKQSAIDEFTENYKNGSYTPDGIFVDGEFKKFDNRHARYSRSSSFKVEDIAEKDLGYQSLDCHPLTLEVKDGKLKQIKGGPKVKYLKQTKEIVGGIAKLMLFGYVGLLTTPPGWLIAVAFPAAIGVIGVAGVAGMVATPIVNSVRWLTSKISRKLKDKNEIEHKEFKKSIDKKLKRLYAQGLEAEVSKEQILNEYENIIKDADMLADRSTNISFKVDENGNVKEVNSDNATLVLRYKQAVKSDYKKLSTLTNKKNRLEKLLSDANSSTKKEKIQKELDSLNTEISVVQKGIKEISDSFQQNAVTYAQDEEYKDYVQRINETKDVLIFKHDMRETDNQVEFLKDVFSELASENSLGLEKVNAFLGTDFVNSEELLNNIPANYEILAGLNSPEKKVIAESILKSENSENSSNKKDEINSIHFAEVCGQIIDYINSVSYDVKSGKTQFDKEGKFGILSDFIKQDDKVLKVVVEQAINKIKNNEKVVLNIAEGIVELNEEHDEEMTEIKKDDAFKDNKQEINSKYLKQTEEKISSNEIEKASKLEESGVNATPYIETDNVNSEKENKKHKLSLEERINKSFENSKKALANFKSKKNKNTKAYYSSLVRLYKAYVAYNEVYEPNGELNDDWKEKKTLLEDMRNIVIDTHKLMEKAVSDWSKHKSPDYVDEKLARSIRKAVNDCDAQAFDFGAIDGEEFQK